MTRLTHEIFDNIMSRNRFGRMHLQAAQHTVTLLVVLDVATTNCRRILSMHVCSKHVLCNIRLMLLCHTVSPSAPISLTCSETLYAVQLKAALSHRSCRNMNMHLLELFTSCRPFTMQGLHCSHYAGRASRKACNTLSCVPVMIHSVCPEPLAWR